MKNGNISQHQYKTKLIFFYVMQNGITVETWHFHQIFILAFSRHTIILKLCWLFLSYLYFQVYNIIDIWNVWVFRFMGRNFSEKAWKCKTRFTVSIQFFLLVKVFLLKMLNFNIIILNYGQYIITFSVLVVTVNTIVNIVSYLYVYYLIFVL